MLRFLTWAIFHEFFNKLVWNNTELYFYFTHSHDRANGSPMHSILKVQRISHGCATDTVYRLVTTEEGRIAAQILRCSDQIERRTPNERVKITTTESRNGVRVLLVCIMLEGWDVKQAGGESDHVFSLNVQWRDSNGKWRHWLTALLLHIMKIIPPGGSSLRALAALALCSNPGSEIRSWGLTLL